MTKSNILKLYKHLSNLAENGGDTPNPVRNKLIKSRAYVAKTKLEEKFNYLKPKDKTKAETKPKKVKKETKE